MTRAKPASKLFDVMQNLLTETVAINGQNLSKSQIRLLSKLAKLGIMSAQTKQTRTNPYSGVSCNLEPLAVTLYDFIINSHNAGLLGRFVPLTVWNEARYFFLEFWPKEYFDLIDWFGIALVSGVVPTLKTTLFFPLTTRQDWRKIFSLCSWHSPGCEYSQNRKPMENQINLSDLPTSFLPKIESFFLKESISVGKERKKGDSVTLRYKEGRLIDCLVTVRKEIRSRVTESWKKFYKSVDKGWRPIHPLFPNLWNSISQNGVTVRSALFPPKTKETFLTDWTLRVTRWGQ